MNNLNRISNTIIDEQKSGKVVVPWPGTLMFYYAATSYVRWEDFDLEFADPFRYSSGFGSGITCDGLGVPGSGFQDIFRVHMIGLFLS